MHELTRVQSLFALCACWAAGTQTVGETFHPGDSAVWVFESAGERIGYHVSKYLGLDDLAGARAHHFQGSFRLKAEELGGIDVLASADLWTDDQAHPVRFVEQARVGDTYSRVELAVAGKTSKARIIEGPTTREVTLDVDPNAYLLADNFISHLEMILAMVPPGQDAKVPLFSGSALRPSNYTLRSKGAFEDDVGGKHLKGQAYDDSLGESLRVADRRLVEIDIAAARLVIRRSDEVVEPIVIAPPEIAKSSSNCDAEEVRIEHDGAVIAGTVTKKKGAQGKQRACFFVSGSGVQDRNGFSSGLDLGTHEILDRLTDAGFLVLRVDDRGAGASSSLPPEPSYLDLVADARACVDFLMKRDDVDPARVMLIGHSEGAETAPILAAERAGIAALVLLAPPGRPIVDVIADQNRLALQREGVGGDELEKQMKDVRAFLQKLASDEPLLAKTNEERTALASRKWYQSHARHDPIATIRQVRCPVLILQGEKDFQVSPDKDARALAAALDSAHHPDHELRVLPGLDHLFKKSPGETSEYGDYWKSRPVDAGMLDALVAWADAHVGAAKH